MASFRKRGKVWYYRYVDGNGAPCEVKGCTDRRATEDLARDAESYAARVRQGLANPKDFVYRDACLKPLADHLESWRQGSIASNSTAKHVALFVGRARRVVAFVMGAELSEIEPAKNAKRLGDSACRYEPYQVGFHGESN